MPLFTHILVVPVIIGTGSGFTLMVKVFDGPLQLVPPLVKVGVTVMVAMTGLDPVLVVVNEGILPVPEAASPIEGAELVQL